MRPQHCTPSPRRRVSKAFFEFLQRGCGLETGRGLGFRFKGYAPGSPSPSGSGHSREDLRSLGPALSFAWENAPQGATGNPFGKCPTGHRCERFANFRVAPLTDHNDRPRASQGGTGDSPVQTPQANRLRHPGPDSNSWHKEPVGAHHFHVAHPLILCKLRS